MSKLCRPLKNKTGIDLSVTGHDAAPSARQVKDYYVVVITRLPHFKRAEHSEEDVVQFMVSVLGHNLVLFEYEKGKGWFHQPFPGST